MERLRIAMVAPPWLTVPPDGYGGVETMLHSLVVELVRLGHDVEIFSVGDSNVPVRNHWLFEHAEYDEIFRSLYDNVAIPVSHLLMAKRRIASDDFDIVHDHNYLLGPAVLTFDASGPPTLHTLHGPFFPPSADGPAPNIAVYELLADQPNLWFNGISAAQLVSMPSVLRRRSLGVVHHGIKIERQYLDGTPRDGFLTLARFVPEKGHDVAARVCAAGSHRLALAGSVGALDTAAAVEAALRDTRPRDAGEERELRYFAEEVAPHLVPGRVEYVGAVRGETKRRLLCGSKALLMPIDWEEPFGVAAIEALACGTPVVAFRRGALREIVDHGVTGFLVSNDDEFATALAEIDEIDPEACRRAASERFSATAMARHYIDLYRQVLVGSRRTARFTMVDDELGS